MLKYLFKTGLVLVMTNDSVHMYTGMDMCFACHRTIYLGLSWTSTLARSAGNDPEEPHAPVGLTWSNAIFTSSASIQPQLNPSRRTVIKDGLS